MVPIFQDTEFEAPETITLTLSDPQGGAVLGGQTTATLTIIDDDAGAAAPGEIDAAFLPAGANGQVNAVARAADGKLLVGGNFSIIGGMNRNRIARLNADGTVDTTFHPAAFADGAVHSIAALADGRVVLGGNFGEVNAVTRSKVARLRADGTLDTVFNPGAINGVVNAVVPVSSGRYLIGGSFSNIAPTARLYFARLLSDGTLDTGFTPAALDNAVQSVAVDANGKTLLGGSFTKVGTEARRRIARLLADGALDPSFHPGQGANSTINAVLPYANAADGMLVGGSFNQFNGVTA